MTTPDATPVVPDAPTAQAATCFGANLHAAQRYVALLADTGVSHGLIGPREVPRLWTRHVLNCAVVAELVPTGERVIDIGSGAGLPGIPLALARLDLEVVLVEPLQRRVAWLSHAVDELGLANVKVHRGRAEDLPASMRSSVVTARAVARLGRLATWCAPVVSPGGRLLALKGDSAAMELAQDRAAVRRAGFVGGTVRRVGTGVVDPPTTVVECLRGQGQASPSGARTRSGGRG
ncbi:MAG: 16S rRNA (guanine(527)-N(7))-methyltransferase RsmG [Dermatophilaceae bacterium]